MSSTSGLVKITSARNPAGIVRYNMKTSKTEGKWKEQGHPVQQRDLIGFYGTANHPGLSLRQEGNLFALQANNNARMSNVYNTKTKHRMMYDNLPNRLSTCHTIVQSFDYQANPNLTPEQVHHMGEQLLVGVRNYLKSRYGYNLDNAMISTHIDDNKDVVRRGKTHHKHLHNHIVIMSYNNSGQSISPYLRIPDLYCFKRINDQVASQNGLKDYYFLKLEREIKPNSSFTKTRAHHVKTNSNLQKAVHRFAQANNHAFDVYPSNYQKAINVRNNELTMAYGFKKRDKRDTRTHQIRHQFTMNDFVNKTNHQAQWYNLNNLRLLAWKNHRDEKCERLIKQFHFNKVKNKAVSYRNYLNTIQQSFKQMPSLKNLNSKQKRRKYQILLKLGKEHYSSQHSTPYTKFLNDLHRLNQDSNWQKESHNPYNLKTHNLEDDFIVKNFNQLSKTVNKHQSTTSTTSNSNGVSPIKQMQQLQQLQRLRSQKMNQRNHQHLHHNSLHR